MVQMVHPEGVSQKGTKPASADRGTELNGPIKPCGIGCPAAAAAILLGYQKDVMDVELVAHYIGSQTR
jgi:hypothetical protein